MDKTEVILVPQMQVPLRQIVQMSRDGWEWKVDDETDMLMFWRSVRDCETLR